MPPIEGNFDKELEILWDGKGVAARGPLEGVDKETSVTLHVVVMQNGAATGRPTATAATGRTGDDVPPEGNEFVIAATVQGDGKLEPGAAIATGLALPRGKEVEMYQWATPVTLIPNSKSKPKANANRSSADIEEALSPTRKSRTKRTRTRR
jgi:hypothetical protein